MSDFNSLEEDTDSPTRQAIEQDASERRQELPAARQQVDPPRHEEPRRVDQQQQNADEFQQRFHFLRQWLSAEAFDRFRSVVFEELSNWSGADVYDQLVCLVLQLLGGTSGVQSTVGAIGSGNGYPVRIQPHHYGILHAGGSALRLCTFYDCPRNPDRRRQLAIDGFVYTGHGDHVTCCHCGIQYTVRRLEEGARERLCMDGCPYKTNGDRRRDDDSVAEAVRLVALTALLFGAVMTIFVSVVIITIIITILLVSILIASTIAD